MNKEATASITEGGGGARAEAEVPPSQLLPLPSNSLPLSDALSTPEQTVQIPGDSFEAFVRSNYNGETTSNLLMPPTSQAEEADAIAHSDGKSTADKHYGKHSRLSGIVNRVLAEVSSAKNNSKASNGTSPMEADVDPCKNSRKRTLNEALEQPDAQLTSKSLKADAANPDVPVKRGLSNGINSATMPDTNNKGKGFSALKYTSNDKAPYIIYIYTKNSSHSSAEAAHPLHVSKLIANIAYNEIIELKKIGKGKIMAELKTHQAANNLVSSELLDRNNLHAFIPTYRTLRTGTVRDIPSGINEDELLKAIEAPGFNVLEVRRFNRRIREEGNIKYIPSSTICVKFAGQLLPKHIFIFKTRHEVFPFVPKTKVCFKCYRVGHISSSCRGSERCLRCGQSKHSEDKACPAEDNPPQCINCQGNHLATSSNCPIVIRNGAIASLAATHNISIFEARKMINQEHYGISDFRSPDNSSSRQDTHSNENSYGSSSQQVSDPRVDFRNFPFLRNRGAQSPSAPPTFNQNNRFASLNPDEYLSTQSDQYATSYAHVTASRRPPPINGTGRNPPSRSPGQDSRFQSHPSQRVYSVPGREAHIYPNGRSTSQSGNGIAFRAGSLSPEWNRGDSPRRNFSKDIANFFFQNLLPLILKGEYSSVLDSSISFILDYFHSSAIAQPKDPRSPSDHYNNAYTGEDTTSSRHPPGFSGSFESSSRLGESYNSDHLYTPSYPGTNSNGRQ